MAALILSSSYPEVVDSSVHDRRFVQTMDILVELILQSKLNQLGHVPFIMNLTDIMADVFRHHQALLRTSNLLFLDGTAGKLRRNVDAMCEETLSFVQDMKSQSEGTRRSKAKRLTTRFLQILDLCQLSEATASESASQDRMKKIAQIFDVVVDTITLFTYPHKRTSRFKDVIVAVKAAFKACPTFQRMNEAAEQQLEAYLAFEYDANDKDKITEIPAQIEAPSQAKNPNSTQKEYPETSTLTQKVQEGVSVSLVEINSWEGKTFSLRKFDQVMAILRDMMEYSSEDWNPRADAKVKECIDKMLKSVEGINKVELRRLSARRRLKHGNKC